MNIQIATLFYLCLALAMPLLVFSTSQHHLNGDRIDDNEVDFNRLAQLLYQRQHAIRPLINEHYLYKKAADYEQILRPCNQMPAGGRGQEYSDCVRSRMLLMGKRKRRQAS
ncbi:unnamed protein product [Adineta ricciae]|uniref:Uncharacterized protein n=1 Tax=Adineta ricciae TaxID=249248 RepID=A0A813ZGV0_ADIRI|nr:unnamed protein product [Adineta ricciae]CAF1209440.1 unnamed protein product [Adineta ricciae]